MIRRDIALSPIGNPITVSVILLDISIGSLLFAGADAVSVGAFLIVPDLVVGCVIRQGFHIKIHVDGQEAGRTEITGVHA